MDEFEKLLTKHMAKYPAMQSSDAVKLLYQSCFGAGHIVDNPAYCLKRLEQEWECATEASDCVEDLGNGRVRLYLGAIKREMLTAVSMAFAAGANEKREFVSCFKSGLDIVARVFDAGQFVRDYIEQGCKALSHSIEYRQAYKPAYRVMERDWLRLVPVICGLESALASAKKSVVLAIDGGSASGKTTMAGKLSEIYGAPVIHMDDFFLPLEMRTPGRLAETGGNVHYERFSEEVIVPIKAGKAFEYRRFDCSVMNFSERVRIPKANLYIIEGAYSMHPYFAWSPDVSVFVHIDADEQRRRIIKRNGEMLYEIFKEEWIPMEKRYFDKFEIEKKCTTVI